MLGVDVCVGLCHRIHANRCTFQKKNQNIKCQRAYNALAARLATLPGTGDDSKGKGKGKGKGKSKHKARSKVSDLVDCHVLECLLRCWLGLFVVSASRLARAIT